MSKGKMIYPIKVSHLSAADITLIDNRFGLNYWLEGPYQLATENYGAEVAEIFNDLLKELGLK